MCFHPLRFTRCFKVLRNDLRKLSSVCFSSEYEHDPGILPPQLFLHFSIHTTVLELLLFLAASVRRTLSCDTSAQILCDICNSKTCVINCLHLSFVKILLAQCVVSFADYSSHSNTGGFFLLTAKPLLNPRTIRGFSITKKRSPHGRAFSVLLREGAYFFASSSRFLASSMILALALAGTSS